MSTKKISKKDGVLFKIGKKKITKQHLQIAAAVLIVVLITIWLCDVLYGESDNPVDWSRDMPRDSIAAVQLSYWNVEGYPNGLHVTMTDEMVDELYAIIQDLRRDDFARGSVSNGDASILIQCHNVEFLLEYKGGVTGLVFDEMSSEVYGGGRDWKITEEAIGTFVEKYKAVYFEQLGIAE